MWPTASTSRGNEHVSSSTKWSSMGITHANAGGASGGHSGFFAAAARPGNATVSRARSDTAAVRAIDRRMRPILAPAMATVNGRKARVSGAALELRLQPLQRLDALLH